MNSETPTKPAPKCSDHTGDAERQAFNLDAIQSDNIRTSRLAEEFADELLD